MITLTTKHTVTLSVSQARRHRSQLLDLIEETGAVVLLTYRTHLKYALLPCEAAQGRGLAITTRGRPVAALVGLKDDTSLWRATRD